MNFSDYSPLALRTAKPLTQEQNLKHAAILMISEAGEIADAIKAFAIYGKPLDNVNLVEEVGDLLWGLNLYITARELKPSMVDDLISMYETFKPKRITDPWELVDLAILVGVMSSTVGVRAFPDRRFGDEAIDSLCRTLVRLLDYTGFSLSHALELNLGKLAKRYGDKYSDYLAVNRDTAAERVVLEGKDADAS